MKKRNNNLDEAINALKNESVSTSPPQEVINTTLQKLTEASQESQPVIIKERIKITERIKAMKTFTKLAAVAAVIVTGVLLITFLNKSVTPAYAIEQTIEANHSVRYLHIRDFMEGMEEPKEFWLEFDEQGNVKNVRAYMPEWDAPSDGAKVTIWQQGKATVWFKKKKALLTIRDKRVAQQVLKMAQEFDPKLAVERLREREKRGWVKIEIEEPSNKTEPITVTVTYLPESPTPGRRGVLFIDQATKLVTAIETYQLKENDYQYLGVMEFYDYNQRIDPEMFTLDNLPADIMRIDQTTQEVGLVQGQLSDDEIAVEVARQFFQALIDRDYAKAGKLYEGIPAEEMKKIFGKMNFIRIVSIGKPTLHPIPATRFLCVPCEIEVEVDEVRSIKEYVPNIREVYNQPERWTIGGGI